MSGAKISGYKKKTKEELLKAIDECLSLSQLYALIQLEGISMTMHEQEGASNLKQRVLSPQEIIKENDSPLDRLRAEIRKAVELAWSSSLDKQSKKTDSALLKSIDECETLSELFALIRAEGITLKMHTQTGASNLTPRVLSPKAMTTDEIIQKKDTPLERFKKQVKQSVSESE